MTDTFPSSQEEFRTLSSAPQFCKGLTFLLGIITLHWFLVSSSVFRQSNLKPRKCERVALGCTGNYLIIKPERETSSPNLKFDLLSTTLEYSK